jgi:hypothetical protein
LVKLNAKLDGVAKAKQAYVLARSTLEARLREQMRTELANLQTQVDIAVRYAVDAGETKADVLRALGTKDYNTLKASLDRTQAVKEIKGTNPLDSVYSLDDDILTVNYVGHGHAKISGTAQFEVAEIDGRVFLRSQSPLYNEDYSERNDVVGWLDGRTDGEYYNEVAQWLLYSE